MAMHIAHYIVFTFLIYFFTEWFCLGVWSLAACFKPFSTQHYIHFVKYCLSELYIVGCVLGCDCLVVATTRFPLVFLGLFYSGSNFFGEKGL